MMDALDPELGDGAFLAVAFRQQLRNRADSYWADARTLRALGDTAMAVAYETIAKELRATADGLDGGKMSS